MSQPTIITLSDGSARVLLRVGTVRFDMTTRCEREQLLTRFSQIIDSLEREDG